MIRWMAFLCVIHGVAVGQQRESINEVAITSGRIQIVGATNVSGFTCGFIESNQGDSLLVVSRWTDLQIQFDQLNLKFPVSKFDCGLALMTQDFRDLIKSKDYPTLTLKINQINISAENIGFEELEVDTEVLVTLAGMTRKYWINDAMVINRTDKELTLKGNKVLKMTDFGIVPPSKFFGTVQVKDELLVSFEVDLKVEAIKKDRG